MKSMIHERLTAIQQLALKANTFPTGSIENFVLKLEQTFKIGGKIVFLGNGGSAAEAMHLAAEFTGKCVLDHQPFAALCLNESQSSMTAVANDYGFEFIFSRAVKALLKPEDILVALSTSGKSPNVINALNDASKIGASCYLWTGSEIPKLENVEIWSVPARETPRIQEVHLMWGHIIAEVFEERLNVRSL
jgi:D-sedoheptulose 7-phosphate isomerase